MREGEVRRI
jgi:hypothetical protein